MPQSLSKVILHIIFSTKNRESWLESSVGPRMHAYLAKICRDLGAELVRVGGVADHVHIVTALPRTVSQAELIEQIKKASSKWIKSLDLRYRDFLAARLRRVFGESQSARCRAAIRRGATGAPSHADVSGGTQRVAAQARPPIRRAVCLGLKRAPQMIRAFGAYFGNRFFLGRCPRLE
jgi:putative transposase